MLDAVTPVAQLSVASLTILARSVILLLESPAELPLLNTIVYVSAERQREKIDARKSRICFRMAKGLNLNNRTFFRPLNGLFCVGFVSLSSRK